MGNNSELKGACREALSLLANALEKEALVEIAHNDTMKMAIKKKRASHIKPRRSTTRRDKET